MSERNLRRSRSKMLKCSRNVKYSENVTNLHHDRRFEQIEDLIDGSENRRLVAVVGSPI